MTTYALPMRVLLPMRDRRGQTASRHRALTIMARQSHTQPSCAEGTAWGWYRLWQSCGQCCNVAKNVEGGTADRLQRAPSSARPRAGYRQLSAYAATAVDRYWIARVPHTIGGLHLELFDLATALQLTLEGDEVAQ